jgi:hypothetical protein
MLKPMFIVRKDITYACQYLLRGSDSTLGSLKHNLCSTQQIQGNSVKHFEMMVFK